MSGTTGGATSGITSGTESDAESDAEKDLVQVEGLRKAFGDTVVLENVGFTAASGTCTVLLGPSGSGKTTVLRSLNVLETPDAGLVRIGGSAVDFGQPVRDRGARRREVASLRARSGMVFQAHHLFPHKTVLGNVVEGPVQVQRRDRAEAEADARRLLDQVGLAGRETAYPAELSGGQQQRVGIARALALRPDVVLLDEPTSALDPELVGEVLAVVRDLSEQGWTMVIVTHEVRFARDVADQVLFLHGGVVAERGGAEVLTDPQEERTQQFLRRVLDAR